jgi:hypothetical protein
MKRTCLVVLPFLLLAGCRAQDPPVTSAARGDLVFPGRDISMAWDTQGRLHAIHVEDGTGGARVVYRRLDRPGHGPVTVSPPGVTTNAGGETPPVLQVLADGTLLAAYTLSLPGQWRNQIVVQRSTDGGATWSVPQALPNGGDPGSQDQFSATAVSGGPLVFAWLESRQGVRGLRAARTPDGSRFEPDLAVDGTTCECCGTALLAGSTGEVWLAYRDVSEGDVRDVHLAASRDGGASFGPPHPVSDDGWKLDGCPDRGPRLAQARDGSLWTAWFTGAEPGVYAAVSRDGGATFGPRQPIITLGGDVRNALSPEIGILPDGRIAVFYETFRESRAHQVEARLRSSTGNDWSAPVVVEPDAGSPRLATRGQRAVVAFIRQRGEAREILVRDWKQVFPPAG